METAPSTSHSVQAMQDIAFGSIAGIVGKYVEYPFDTVKVRLQSQPDGRPPIYKGPLDCFSQSLKAGGVLGLYRGVSAPVAGAAIETSCLFFNYTLAQRLLAATLYKDDPCGEKLPLVGLTAAGACSGAFTSLVLTPVELVKCKMQVPASSGSQGHQGPISTIALIFRNQGLLGFWRGQLGTLIRESGGSAAWFGAYEGVSHFFRKRNEVQGKASGQTTVAQQLLAGACAGISYNVSFYPADTIKSRMQTEDVARVPGSDAQRRTFWSVGKALWRDQGLKGMYRGCGITALRSAPSSALVFTIYEWLKAHFA